MEENKICDEGQKDQVSDFNITSDIINLECNNLPESTIKVQSWLRGQVTDTELGNNNPLPEINVGDNDQTFIKEVENDDKSSGNFLPLPPLEGSGNTDASGSSDATELDPGDPEILVNRKTTTPSADSIAEQNSECDREYFYIMMEGLAKKMMETRYDMQNQTKILIDIVQQNKIENNNILKEVTMSVVENVNIGLKSSVTEIKSEINHNLLSIQSQIQNEMSINKGEITENFLIFKGDVLLAQEELKQDLKSDISKIQNEVFEIKGNVQNELQSGITQMKNDFKSELTQVENKMQSAEVNHKKDMDKLLLQGEGMATNVIAAITSVEGHVQALRQDLGTLHEEIEFLNERIQKIEGETNRELTVQGNELVHMRDRVNSLERQVEDARAELQVHTSGNNSLVNGLESQVDTLKRSIEEIRGLYHECQDSIVNLEGVVEANATQGNVLNNHLHEIDSKLQGVAELPEILQRTLVETLKSYKNEVDTNTDPKLHLLQGCPNQPKDTNKPVPAVLPDSNNIPSIPSSPLLANSFLTPASEIRQAITDPLGLIHRNRNVRSDHVIADIVKREQKPYFDGDNVSPPIFLQEVERFFELIQITEDRDRLQLFPAFLVTNPFEWWQIISYQVTTWDMAKELFLKQYFNDYERQRYKAEWYTLDCKNFSNVEEFTLRGLKILNTIKTRDSEQKKCERITVKLPEPLRDYLLNKQFQSTQHFLSCIKEAMLLKNFNSNLYFRKQKSNGSASTGNSSQYNLNNGRSHNTSSQKNTSQSSNGNNSNSNNSNTNSSNNNSSIPNMNPRYKGNPRNYIPNFRYPNNNSSSAGASSSNSNSPSGHRSPPRTPPRSPPRTQNQPGSTNVRSSGQGYQNNGRTYYRGSGNNNNRTQTNRSAGATGASTPGLGVNQVGWAPTTPNSPSRATSPTPTTQRSASPPLTRLYLTFPSHLLKTDGSNRLSPQVLTTDHFDGEEYEEPMDEQKEN